MASPIGNMRNVKIFVLYLMTNIGYPMNFATINDVTRQNDYVMYLDFVESFYEMLEHDLIVCVGKNEADEDLYSVTYKGRCVAEELKSDILPSILDQSLRCALRYLDFRKRGVRIETNIVQNADKTYDLECRMFEKGEVIMAVTLKVDSRLRAESMADNFRENPENIYKGVTALVAGNVNYLFP
ncbi:MAG: DUF4364 family protein [Clostridia bacterium]|nr:DUF4364 family protein [Clostridia bacterium]MBQ2256817.1 DUF4364 family protein [Clostridia bacterium]MBQ5361763.1 DUF4364 family protein [Clostridia bacterium]